MTSSRFAYEKIPSIHKKIKVRGKPKRNIDQEKNILVKEKVGVFF